jgi:hypothetical protein
MWGFQVWEAKLARKGQIYDAKGLLFIDQASVICSFQNISKFGKVNCMFAWACTGPWSYSIRSKCKWNEVWMRIGLQEECFDVWSMILANWYNPVQAMRRPFKLCPKWINLDSLEILDQEEQLLCWNFFHLGLVSWWILRWKFGNFNML